MEPIKLKITYKNGIKNYSIDKKSSNTRTYIDTLLKLRKEIAYIYGFEYSGSTFSKEKKTLSSYIKKNNESVKVSTEGLCDFTYLVNISDEEVVNEALSMITACKKLQKQLLDTQYEKEYIFEM